MINYDKDLAGYDPITNEKPRHFHIENIIRLLDRIEDKRHKANERIFEPGGQATAFESLHEMQSTLEVAYSHALRLQEWIKAGPDPDICEKS